MSINFLKFITISAKMHPGVFLAVNQQCITYMCCDKARTLDHLIGSQAPYPIAKPS